MSRNTDMFIDPAKIIIFLRKCKEAGHNVIVTSVARAQVEQDALYAQNRHKLPVVNALRKIASLPPITEEENKNAVTWTRKSEHLTSKEFPKSRAFDFGILDKNGKYVGDVKADVNHDNQADYLQCALIGEGIGLYSGRHFSKPDFPHLQVTPIK